MAGIMLLVAFWTLGAIVRDGVLVTLRSIVVAFIGLIVIWHMIGEWLMEPIR